MAHEVTKLRYTHEALADMLLTCPDMTQKELAVMFDRSPVWVGYTIASDAFQFYLAKRREELVDPGLMLTIDDRLKGLVTKSVDVLMEKLEENPTADLAVKALELGSKALGYGARPQGGAVVNNNFVVAMPGKVESAVEWADKYAGGVLEAGSPNG
jgi:hypothetical protein